jgi:hypothetical protein
MATGRIPDPNTAPLTAKGDLYTYSTVPARLAVGSNGDTLVADSAATTGLRWQGNYSAGKNAIINGDFRLNQRSFSSTTTGGFGFDRFGFYYGGGTVTYSAQTFTPGTAPVAGYEAINFARLVNASQSAAGDYSVLFQRIEDVRTFAGQTVTLSFWAKAGSGTPKIGVSLLQNFGSGGSSTVYTASTAPTITTSWARYSFTLNVPSISGKTVGSSSFLEVAITTSAGTTIQAIGYPAVGVQNATFDIWGVQLEAGNVATAFQTATGTLQGELAACQRYYYRIAPGAATKILGNAFNKTTTTATATVVFPVTMRTAPTAIEQSGTASHYVMLHGNDVQTQLSAVPSFGSITTTEMASILTTVASGLTAGDGCLLITNNSAAYLGWGAEL